MQRKFKTWCRRDRGGKYYVQFAHSPGKWYGTGTTEKRCAEEWAYLNQEPGLKPAPEKVTLRLFSSEFFIGDSQGWVARQEKRGKNFAKLPGLFKQSFVASIRGANTAKSGCARIGRFFYRSTQKQCHKK